MVAVISHSDGLLHFPIPVLLLFHTLLLLYGRCFAGCGRLLLFVGCSGGNRSAVLGCLGCNGNKK